MPDLGTKYECTGCGAKFYDLGKADAVCPKCGLNPLTEEVEEIGEEQPAAASDEGEEPESDGDEATPDDDDADIDIDLDEDDEEAGSEGEDE